MEISIRENAKKDKWFEKYRMTSEAKPHFVLTADICTTGAKVTPTRKKSGGAEGREKEGNAVKR